MSAKAFVIDLRNATQTAIKNISFGTVAQELGSLTIRF
jgi:hypothetical protein